MSGDPLDRIAGDMRERQGRDIQWTWYDTSKVLALVEVARAAREVDRIYEGLRTDENDGEFALWSDDQLVVALHGLRPALARLDKDTT